MKFTRKAQAQWKGSGKEGKGTLSTASGVLDKTPHSFHTRFEDGEKGTNPEELVGAAHAGCFAMQLSFLLGEDGFTPKSLDIDATVTFEDGEVTVINLDLEGDIPDIDAEQFQQIAHKAKEVCPISKLLKADIQLKVSLKK
ncbi:MAG TPA: OsmC family peroxiredoxin [Muricauda sp.]|uniref:OsmC family protein n=1 Tax=Flagellimonas aurea TaxID=2915619 RepID=A0ABS3G395_9FLAO|nr:OsmC family protein [Allomuricauda aurea]MAO17215.1 OsmC family peroxiredoxin [Allomuricauda sp.]MBC72830.1 OsmC family peroxiredoxin [Allomuricauda sp.]MBO0353052.1 OsmC family protein [Allomuricauda aurea]HBU78127.1 OsmC family peroxiredoxin [Allomuricauda sp.]|tara:strand:- start:5197 stop:5619 length:423 start_codon:yes stop_codon:yes gene_type:complete